MCTPTALLLSGALVQGAGAASQMSAQARQSEMQAALSEKQAREERISGKFQAERLTDKLKRVGGQQRAAFAEGGLGMGGSNFDVMMDTAQEGDLDVASVLWNSRSAADSKKFEAQMHRNNARTSRRGMPLAFLSPILSTAAKFPTEFGMK